MSHSRYTYNRAVGMFDLNSVIGMKSVFPKFMLYCNVCMGCTNDRVIM